MNKAIFVILLGLLILAQANDLTIHEENSETQEMAKGENNERQLLTVKTTHEFFFAQCFSICSKTRSSPFCIKCCQVNPQGFLTTCK